MVPGIQRNPPYTNLGQPATGNPISDSSGSSTEGAIAVPQRLSNNIRQPKLRQEILILQQQVQLLKHRAEELEAERNNAYHNTQIWKRRVLEQEQLAEERERAIERLVQQNLDKHMQKQEDGDDDSASAWEVLQGKANETFTKKQKKKEKEKEKEKERTIEQYKTDLKSRDDIIKSLYQEVKRLNAYNKQHETAQTSQVSNLLSEVRRLKTALHTTEQEYLKAKEGVKRLESLDCKERQTTIERLQGENESLLEQLREVKRQLWKAKDSSGVVRDLKQELSETKARMRILEDEKNSAMLQARRQVEEEVRLELKAAEETHRFLEERLLQLEGMQQKVPPVSNSFPKSSLRSTLSDAILHREQAARLEKRVQELTKALEAKNVEIKNWQRKVEDLEIRLEMETDSSKVEESRIQDQAYDLKSKTRQHQAAEDQVKELQRALTQAEANIKTLSEQTSSQLPGQTKQMEELEAKYHAAQSRSNELEAQLEAKSLELAAALEESDPVLAARHSTEKDMWQSHKNQNEARIATLEAELEATKSELATSQARIEKLHGAIDKTSNENNLRYERDVKELEDQIETLIAKLESSAASIEEAESKTRRLEAELQEARNESCSAFGSKDFQGALDQAQKSREASEKSIVNTYEHKMSELSAEKDAIIDDLRKDLSALRSKRTDEVSELNREVSKLRKELDEIHQNYDDQLKQKHQHIYALEHTLHAQEQTMDNMRDEMDQLQNSMRDTANSRRSEAEDLQQEVMKVRAEMSMQEKAVIRLQMQLKEEQLEHASEVMRLKQVIAECEREVPKAQAMASIENDQRMLMVMERLDQLKMRNNELKEENKKLGERLEKGIIKVHKLEAKCSEAENVKIECDMLRQQVIALEDALHQIQYQATEASTVPETESVNLSRETKSGSVLGLLRPPAPLKEKFLDTLSSDRKSSRLPRRRIGDHTAMQRLLKMRRRSFSSSSAALVDGDIAEKVEKQPRKRSKSARRAGGTMYF